MGSVTLNGATSGQITLSPPAVAGTNTITLPAATGTLIYGTQPTGTIVGTTDTQTLTNKTLTSPNIGGTPVMNASIITQKTAVASTSGTSIDFTSIPSWVNRITVAFSGVSTSGTSNLIVQLGTGATPTYTTSGYLGTAMTTTGTTTTLFTSGFILDPSAAAAQLFGGLMTIVNISGNTWAETSILGGSNTVSLRYGAGSVPLAATLTAVRITTAGGTDTFDAGTINILYE